MAEKWMQRVSKSMNHGALHRELHVPEGEKIPEAKIEKAEHSKNPLLRKRAFLAATFAHERPHKPLAHGA